MSLRKLLTVRKQLHVRSLNSIDFRTVVRDLRINTKSPKIEKGYFPFEFTTLLNFLQLKTERKYATKEFDTPNVIFFFLFAGPFQDWAQTAEDLTPLNQGRRH